MMRRLVAAGTLATFVVALLLPSVTTTHAWNDPDLSGGVVFGAPGSGETSVGQASRVEGADHCALCHWLRSLGHSLVALGQPVPALTEPSARLGVSAASLPKTCSAACAARAPPSVVL